MLPAWSIAIVGARHKQTTFARSFTCRSKRTTGASKSPPPVVSFVMLMFERPVFVFCVMYGT